MNHVRFPVNPAKGRRIHLASKQISSWTGETSHATNCGLFYPATVAPRCGPDDGPRCKICFGHHLVAEGQPHDDFGTTLVHSWDGRALCGCGWLSEELPTMAARRRAHAAHRLEVSDEG